MMDLRQELKNYLDIRRSLGSKLRGADTMLSSFLDTIEAAESPIITTSLAIDWATRLEAPRSSDKRLTLVRGFARYVHTFDPRTQVPPPYALPHPRRSPPYLYSDEDVGARMDAALELKEHFRALTYRTLVGLLAVTGARVGEMIALDRTDVDWEEDVLTMRAGKFGKSREVALHPTTVTALRAYAEARQRRFPRASTVAFFVSLNNTRLIYQNVRDTFHRLADRVGLGDRKPPLPRIHGLRHAFAIRTLVDWYRAGHDVERMLPLLSTYLGHVSPSTTYWYLTAVPELLGAAAKRLEEHLGELP
jgi:integrase